jgi:hypothetical protein
MSTISLTRLYELLIPKMGKEAAENLTTFVEHKIDTELEKKTQILATKEDLRDTKEELQKEISRLDIRISNSKVDIIRWLVTLWITLILMILGLYLKP